ncbi:unnamed protein product [Calypogeia fissa]
MICGSIDEKKQFDELLPLDSNEVQNGRSGKGYDHIGDKAEYPMGETRRSCQCEGPQHLGDLKNSFREIGVDGGGNPAGGVGEPNAIPTVPSIETVGSGTWDLSARGEPQEPQKELARCSEGVYQPVKGQLEKTLPGERRRGGTYLPGDEPPECIGPATGKDPSWFND